MKMHLCLVLKAVAAMMIFPMQAASPHVYRVTNLLGGRISELHIFVYEAEC